MKRKGKPAGQGGRNQAEPVSQSAPAPLPPPRPFQPRHKLFWVLCVMLAIWAAMLLTLYFSTVRPYMSKQASPAATQR